ncbi:MAG: ArsR family transcriptional regulator [Candidatus Acidiferrum sp.]
MTVGLVVSEIQQELDIPNSTLSHHLANLPGNDKLQLKVRFQCLLSSINLGHRQGTGNAGLH